MGMKGGDDRAVVQSKSIGNVSPPSSESVKEREYTSVGQSIMSPQVNVTRLPVLFLLLGTIVSKRKSKTWSQLSCWMVYIMECILVSA